MALATPTGATGEPGQILNSKTTATWPLRTATLPTTAYVATDHYPVGTSGSGGLVLTLASADYTSVETAIQGSRDGTTFFDIPTRNATNTDAHSQTLANLSAADNVGYLVPFSCAEGVLYVRALVKRTGGTAVGTVAVDGYAGSMT